MRSSLIYLHAFFLTMSVKIWNYIFFWQIGNHDNSRVVTRLGENKARLAAVLTMSLSGTPGMYYGEEIGMVDGVEVNVRRVFANTS